MSSEYLLIVLELIFNSWVSNLKDKNTTFRLIGSFGYFWSKNKSKKKKKKHTHTNTLLQTLFSYDDSMW